MEKRVGIALIAVIVLLAILSRFMLLDLRPLHHDEGVNYFFAENIVSGNGWAYDPLNYHGPFYFFILAFSFFVFGVSEFSLRFPAAFFGVLVVLSFFVFKIGKKKENYLAALFLLLSPSLIFYSRYSIHESCFVFFSLLCVYFLSLIIKEKNTDYLPHFAVCLALLFTIKETAIIMLFILIAIALINFKALKQIDFRDNYVTIYLAVLLFIFIYAFFFTNSFSHIRGFFDSFKAYVPWIERGVKEIGHDKPFYYYFMLFLKYELPIFLLSLIGLFYAWRKGVFYKNASIWFVLIFLIYGFINYKTPWLIINLVVPTCVLASVGLISIYEKWGKIPALFIFILSVAYLIFFSLQVNFITPWQNSNSFAYVHTDKDIFNLVDKINLNYIEGDKILIVSKEYWPLPFYLHGKDVNYFGNEEAYNFTEYSDYNLFVLRDYLFNEGDWEGYGHEGFKLREGIGLELIWRKK